MLSLTMRMQITIRSLTMLIHIGSLSNCRIKSNVSRKHTYSIRYLSSSSIDPNSDRFLGDRSLVNESVHKSRKEDEKERSGERTDETVD